MKNPDVSIVVPVFNEERLISSTIKQIKEVMNKTKYVYEIIAVNDASLDRSGKILDSIKGIRVIHHPENKGYGASLKTGINNAKSELIVMTDADGTYPIKAIPKLLGYAKDYDMVSGMRSGKEVQIPFFRRPAKFMLSKLANFLTGQKVPDINCGLRVIKKENVTKFFNILSSRFSFTTTHLLACLTSDHSVKFVPINYYKRGGKSTIHPKDFVGFSSLIIRVITYFRPFRVFSLFSLTLFLIGLGVFLYSFFILGRIMDITVTVILLSSLQVFLFGLIADLIVKKKES